MVKTYAELLSAARRALIPTEGEDAARIARELTAFAAGKTMEALLRDTSLYASEPVEKKLNACVAEYLEGKPLAYIFGNRPFYGLELLVDERVLIPRDDTAAVTELGLAAIRNAENPRVLDLCTGSGCIGLAIAHLREDAQVTLADVSRDALSVARENAKRNGLSRRVGVIRADALQAKPAFLTNFDLLIANPPYITAREMAELDRSVRDYEPHLALFGGEDGLDFYRAIAANYLPAVKNGGSICLEFGLGQEHAVEMILKQYDLEEIRFAADASGRIRAVTARKLGKEQDHGKEKDR